MIILTGAAGFIGSCFLWKLNNEGIKDILIVDDLGEKDKRSNIHNKHFQEYIQKDDFLGLIEQDKVAKPTHIIHMGACSSTTVGDENYYKENNYEYSKKLAQWAFKHNSVFIYASSAATYGDGSLGFDDDNDEATHKLAPLNFYGKYKHLFDLWILDNGFDKKATGIKFFNVFGPNEYHKGEMRSVACKKFPEVKNDGVIKLFKSHHPDCKDGEQKRDFIYVKDAVEVMYWFFMNPKRCGIFNLGTGVAHSWNELANAMFAAQEKEPKIEYIEMPEYLRPKYQYFTQARMDKIRAAGCDFKFQPLGDSIKDYAKYLEGHTYL